MRVSEAAPRGERFWFQQLQSLLLDVDDMPLLVTRVAEIATHMADGSISCGVTMRRAGSAVTVGSSDRRSEVLDETQYRVGAGPCLQAMRDMSVVEVTDVLGEPRWPRYTAAAREAGLRSVLSLPLTSDQEAFGAVNLYGFDRPADFTADDRQQLELFAAQTAGVLQVAARHVAESEIRGQMERALRSRTEIDQALGIVMARQSCTASVAFDLLRRASQADHKPLRDVATELIARVTGQPPEPARSFDVT